MPNESALVLHHGQASLSGAKALQHTLSMVSWNAGAARCSKSFVCGATQEGSEEMIAQLQRHGRQVFKANNPRNTAWVFVAKEFLDSGTLVREHFKLMTIKCHWLLCATFVQLIFKAPEDWKVKTVTLGSAHVNNDVAKLPDVGFALLQISKLT